MSKFYNIEGRFMVNVMVKQAYSASPSERIKFARVVAAVS